MNDIMNIVVQNPIPTTWAKLVQSSFAKNVTLRAKNVTLRVSHCRSEKEQTCKFYLVFSAFHERLVTEDKQLLCTPSPRSHTHSHIDVGNTVKTFMAPSFCSCRTCSVKVCNLPYMKRHLQKNSNSKASQ